MSILKIFSVLALCLALPSIYAQVAPNLKTVNAEGLIIEDKVVGTGPAAANGDTVIVNYVGKLTDGKIFDSTKEGQTFSFVLGQGRVIKGWDLGILGMQVDGQRILTIPPSLGYGNQAVATIPRNSTLIFDVKLVKLVKKK